jgi:DNA-binding NarL/FixJ family response regulator
MHATGSSITPGGSHLYTFASCEKTRCPECGWHKVLHKFFKKNTIHVNTGTSPLIALHSDTVICKQELSELVELEINGFTIHPDIFDLQELECSISTMLSGKATFSPTVYQILRGEYVPPHTDVVAYTSSVPRPMDVSYRHQICQELPLRWHKVHSYGELFTTLSKLGGCNVKVVLSLDMLSTQPGGILDMTTSIHNIMCAAIPPIEGATCENPSLYVSVNNNTNICTIRQALQSPVVNGVLGLTGTDFSADEIKAGMTSLINNKFHIPSSVQMRLDHKKQPSNNKTNKQLTGRQQQILDLVCQDGASNKMIANKLKISESTVKLHLGQILKKYNLRNRTQLVLHMSNHTTSV